MTSILAPLRDISFVNSHESVVIGEKHYKYKYIPSGPLPVVPADEEDQPSSEDELEEEARSESPCSELSNASESLSPSEVRHRKRLEQKEKLEAQVKDMKRRQQANEQWTQLKRSLYKPLLIAGTLVLGGGLIAYFYFKN